MLKADLAAAALGVLSQDPSFQAKMGGAEADPQEAENRAPADPGAPADPAVPNPLEERLSKLEQVVNDKQSYITQLQQENQALRASMQQPSSPEPDDDPVSKLEEYGVPSDVAREAITAVVAEGIRAYLAPYLQVEEAERTMRADPVYAEHAPKVEAFVRSDKAIADTVLALANAGNIKAAKAYAWDMYKARNAAALEGDAKARSNALNAERAENKLHAGISPTQKAQSRQTKDTAREEQDALLNAARMSRSKKDIGRYITGALFPNKTS